MYIYTYTTLKLISKTSPSQILKQTLCSLGAGAGHLPGAAPLRFKFSRDGWEIAGALDRLAPPCQIRM